MGFASMRVVITGAAGKIGSQIVEELSDRHKLCLIDRRPVPGRNSVVADLALNRVRSYSKPWLKGRLPRWMKVFDGADVVLHLAAYIRHDDNFPQVLRDNIQATWNVLEAAVRHRVPRVVYASSNWAVKAIEMELAPECYVPTGPKIDSGEAPRPLTLYGISKAFGEMAGRTLVEEGRLASFVSVRIGYYNAVPPSKEDLRRRWIGPTDIRSLFRRCMEADFDGFHVVYGVSAQSTAPYDLSYTKRLFGWEPKQSAN
jgi:uronate dehydrogenase